MIVEEARVWPDVRRWLLVIEDDVQMEFGPFCQRH